MHQPSVVFHPLLEADEEFPEPVMPGAGAFNDPATRRMPLTSRDALTAMADMGDIMPFPHGRLDLREVVPFVETQVLRVLSRRPGRPDSEAVQRGRRRFHIMAVGTGHHDGVRGAALIG